METSDRVRLRVALAAMCALTALASGGFLLRETPTATVKTSPTSGPGPATVVVPSFVGDSCVSQSGSSRDVFSSAPTKEWVCAPGPSGAVTVDVVFPRPVALSEIVVTTTPTAGVPDEAQWWLGGSDFLTQQLSDPSGRNSARVNTPSRTTRVSLILAHSAQMGTPAALVPFTVRSVVFLTGDIAPER